MKRYIPHTEIGRLMDEAGFQNVVTRPVERIQKTCFGEEVLSDPFLRRTSTSQLQLISEEAYAQGKRRIVALLESAKQAHSGVSFDIDFILFATVGVLGN